MTTGIHNIRLPMHPARKRAYRKAAYPEKLLVWMFRILDAEAAKQNQKEDSIRKEQTT